jgi:hypothetical protein
VWQQRQQQLGSSSKRIDRCVDSAPLLLLLLLLLLPRYIRAGGFSVSALQWSTPFLLPRASLPSSFAKWQRQV